ncbi:MAG: hypothetical protein IPK09_00070 [Candidatus Competibacteraceae bacterium]|nr:hypothetical protein [Candidatus Competibacteraceae bacterium]
MVEPSSAVAADAAPVALRDIALLAGLAVVLPILRCYIAEAGGFDLHFDEAQYWESVATARLELLLQRSAGRLVDCGEYGPVRSLRMASAAVCRLAYDLFLLLLFGFARQFWQSRRAGW